jgi:hypothetical protein
MANECRKSVVGQCEKARILVQRREASGSQGERDPDIVKETVSVQVEIVPIDSLTLNPNTVNTHTDEQINELAASLEEFGQQSPLVVRHDGIVLRGNGVLKAARNLGMTDIAIVRSDLVGSHALGYAVADNRLAEKSQRDSAKLLSALEELVDDVPLDALGFSHEEIDALSEEVQVLPQSARDPGGRDSFRGRNTDRSVGSGPPAVLASARSSAEAERRPAAPDGREGQEAWLSGSEFMRSSSTHSTPGQRPSMSDLGSCR